MKYNVFIKSKLSTTNILDISEDNVKKIVYNYNFGKDNFLIRGKMYWLIELCEIKIFTFNNEIYTKDGLKKTCKDQDLYERTLIGGAYIPPIFLSKFGENVTDEYIKGDFGFLSEKQNDMNINELYVAKERIKEIKQIENSNLDFTKLVKMLEELNIAYSNDMVIAIPFLVRAIKDHVPPIFGKSKFDEVANSRTKSVKHNFLNLQNSLKHIADANIHSQIRNKESLPTMIQGDFKSDLDVLLQEIVRITKK